MEIRKPVLRLRSGSGLCYNVPRMKSAFVELIGRPSTGKSSLLNIICGHKISIISHVPQTTRNKIRGIYTEKRGQLVFIDTPGFHSSDRKFNTYLKDLAVATLDEVDIILYLLDVTRAIGPEEEALISLMKKFTEKPPMQNWMN